MLAMNFKRRISFLFIFTLSFLTGNAQNYPAVFDQNSLNGKNGFIVVGLEAGDRLGEELSFIGDINHDGLEDIALNTQYAEPNDLYLGGTTYIIFGSKKPYPSPFDLQTLNGTNGFKVVGIAEDERRGESIGKLGDINGDGIDDIALASEGNKHMFLYGKNGSFPASLVITDINGTNGFIFTQSGVGEIKSAGDVNGDGLNDIVMGQYAWSGESYIIFGRNENFPLNINTAWLDGIKGFRLGKVDANISAFYVGTAGDINADGFDDLMVGVWAGSTAAEGLTYVYFGHAAPFTSLVDLKAVTGADGFAIQNISNYTLNTVGTLGDINGDGIDDCFSRNNIIFGSKNSFPKKLVVDGTNGFSSTGFNQTSAAIGDVNLDGIDDFIVVSNNYENWVVFGSKQPFPAIFDPARLDGTKGFKIENLKQSNVGRQVSGRGDINGDGRSDFMFSSGAAGTAGQGAVYVVFGGNHIALPFNTGFPKATAISYQNFTLQVNAQEKGKAYYAIFNGTQSSITKTTTILNGTGAVKFGEIQISQIATSIDKVITGLVPQTKYDVYVYFEDESWNNGNIYFLDDVTTFADTEKPVITCLADKTLACGAVLSDYASTVTVTDNVDSKLTATQAPAAGTVFYPGMTVTISAQDNAGNKSACSFKIEGEQIVQCPANQSVLSGAVLPDYTKLTTTTGFCTSSVIITQAPLPGTLVEANTTLVTLTAKDANETTAQCTFQINAITTDVQNNSMTTVKLYPNPVSDILYIEGVLHAEYEITDNVGSVVGAGTNASEINVAALAHGMYVVLLYNTEHQLVAIKKIVKN